MRYFKFFQENKTSLTNLRRYHKRLCDRYVYRFNLYHSQPNLMGTRIFDEVTSLINDGLLISYDEIRSYYTTSFNYIFGGEDAITNEVHRELIWSIERPAEVIPLNNIAGELMGAIRGLDDEIQTLQTEINLFDELVDRTREIRDGFWSRGDIVELGEMGTLDYDN